jgi:hypothetical protein
MIRDHLEDLVIAQMQILKCLLEKMGFEAVDWIHLAQDKIQ